MTQSRLAASAGRSIFTITKIERGSVKPGMDTAIAIAHALGLETPIGTQELDLYSEITEINPEILIPPARRTSFNGQNSTTVELMPLLAMAVAHNGRAIVEALLRAAADPALTNNLAIEHQSKPKQAATPSTPALVSATLHGDRVVKVYDKATTHIIADRKQPEPARRRRSA